MGRSVWEPSRRHLLLGGAVLAVTMTVDPFACVLADAAPATPGADPVRSTLEVYVSTLVPGGRDDPHGTPGAVEADAVAQLEAHAPYVIVPIVADVSAAALAAHGQPFAALDQPTREALVVEAFADPTRAPYHLIALAIGAGAFYGDFANRVGGEHLGFPGPSDGYLDTYTDRTGHGQPQHDAVPS
jgi:hypothetical protein